MRHVLSFDIEDWFHMVAIDAVSDPATWPRLHRESTLVERYTDHILDLCEARNVKATFFVLGWVAERHPEMVRRIASGGHELASHSFWHRPVYSLSRTEFAEDLQASIDVIESVAPGNQVRGFRAPSFSITPGTEWAFDDLLDRGLSYDASLFPGSRGHGGYPCERGPHYMSGPSGRSIPELPMSVSRIGVGPFRKSVCFSGGGYLRLLPPKLIEQGIRNEEAAGRATVVYLHPRDFASDCPRVPMPPHRRFKCYVGARGTTDKLAWLLSEFEWTTCVDALAEFEQKHAVGA